MSHYAVLVLHKENQNIDDLLKPYDENLKVAPYLRYPVNEAIKMIKEDYVPYVDSIKNYSDEELFKWFAEQYSSYLVKEDGIYSTYNPNSKWDWYEIGGRFSGKLELTEEGRLATAIKCEKEYNIDIDVDLREDSDYMRYVNSAPVRYINWFYYLTEEEKNKIRRWWEINICNMPLKQDEKKDKYFFYNTEWYKRRYKDAETDIKIQESINFHSIITPDGEWHEPSKMGWWACTNGEPEDELKWDLNFYDNFIKNADPDLIATVVDCHI